MACGSGRAASGSGADRLKKRSRKLGVVACRAAYFESSAVTSYSEAKLHAATAVRMTFRHTDLAMIMSVCAGSCHESGGGLSRTQARADTRHTQESARQESSQRRTGSAAVSEL